MHHIHRQAEGLRRPHIYFLLEMYAKTFITNIIHITKQLLGNFAGELSISWFPVLKGL